MSPRSGSDLVIVYHRQPYEEVVENGKTVFKENKSPNGIVPTLKSFFGRVENAAWVAWKEAEDPSNPDFDRIVEIEDSFGKYTVSRLPLTKEQVSSFYHITSKEAYRSSLVLPQFSQEKLMRKCLEALTGGRNDQLQSAAKVRNFR